MSSLLTTHLATAHPAVHYAILAATTTTTTKPSSSSSSSFLIFAVLIGVAVYLLFIRPRSQAARRQTTMQKQTAVGDRVVTTSGIVGRVRGFIGDRVQVEIADGVTIEVVRQAVGRRLPDELDDDDLIPPPPGADDLDDEHDEHDDDEHDEHRDDEHDDDEGGEEDDDEDEDPDEHAVSAAGAGPGSDAAAHGDGDTADLHAAAVEELPAYADETGGETSGTEGSSGDVADADADGAGVRSRWRRTRQ
jgi:preprotein translocase subunit YajC